jgi:hypothetical protein
LKLYIVGLFYCWVLNLNQGLIPYVPFRKKERKKRKKKKRNENEKKEHNSRVALTFGTHAKEIHNKK